MEPKRHKKTKGGSKAARLRALVRATEEAKLRACGAIGAVAVLFVRQHELRGSPPAMALLDSMAWMFEMGVLLIKAKFTDTDAELKEQLLELFSAVVDQTLEAVRDG